MMNINLDLNRKIWLTSDHHFGHKNIIRLCDRPFTNIDHMHAEMVRLWNETVAPEDVVLYLGDFSMSFGERIAAFIPQLNGEFWMVPGNHDKCFPFQDRQAKAFQDKVARYEAVGVKFFDPNEYGFVWEHEGKRYLFCHFPPLDTEDYIKYQEYRPNYKEYDRIFHGHVHTAWQTKPIGDILCVNVGADVHGFKPILLQDWIIS